MTTARRKVQAAQSYIEGMKEERKEWDNSDMAAHSPENGPVAALLKGH